MNKWTQGPWLLDETTVYTLRPCKSLDLDTFENAWCAQFYQDGRYETSFSEVKANATLASTAPELYEALERALNEWDSNTDWRENARAVMKKARGE